MSPVIDGQKSHESRHNFPLRNKMTVLAADESSWWISRRTYHYFDRLLKLGNSKTLDEDDVYPLGTRSTASFLSQRFDDAWRQEIGNNRNSIYRALWTVVGHEFAKGGVAFFLTYQITVVSPLLMRQIIAWINQVAAGQAPDYMGYVYVVLLFLLQLLQVFCGNMAFEYAMRSGVWTRTALVSAVYEKSLRLSNAARHQFSSGKIVNIMSADISRLDFAMQFVHILWVAPIQIMLCFGLLIWQLGVSALVGLGVILVTMPVAQWASGRLGKERLQASLVADRRVKITQEALSGIKVIKLYGWERPFLSGLEDLRREELKHVTWIHAVRNTVVGLLQTVPIIAGVVSFVVYEALGNTLTAEKAFTCLAFFYSLRIPLLIYPMVIAMAIDFRIALDRIRELLLAEEVDSAPTRLKGEEASEVPYAISVKDASFTWEVAADLSKVVDSEPPGPTETKRDDSVKLDQLKVWKGISHLSHDIPKGSLTAIVGAVGSGKSSLLSGIIGEMKRTQGTVTISGSIAYCAQNAWIQNMTLRDNILFGLPYDENRYNETLRVCALESDLKVLAAGDMTEIGEKGINLSGGQKQRVNLARAVYSNSDIILMDDPLSAVDAHVGSYLFNELIKTALKGMTRVLVTHRLHILPQVDYILVMDNGTVVERGTYQELMGKKNEGGLLAKLMADVDFDQHEEEQKKAVSSSPTASASVPKKSEKAPMNENKAKLITKEERASGQVTSGVYKHYVVLSGGYWFFAFLMFVMAVSQGSRIANDLWLNVWIYNQVPTFAKWQYQITYFGLGLFQALIMVAGGLMFVYSSMRASREIHSKALKKVFHSPMAWFDSQPLGRIINRFSRDLETIDNLLPEVYRALFYTGLMALSIFILISIVLPIFLAPLIPILIGYWYLQKYYRKTSVELKRLDNVTRSPLFALFSESLGGSGQATIRAYDATQRFFERNKALLDQNNRPYYWSQIVQRWLSLRLESLASLLIFFTALLGVIFAQTLNAGLVGLAITYSLQVTFVLNWAIKQWAEMEMHMSSVERMQNYTDTLQDEAELLQKRHQDQQQLQKSSSLEKQEKIDTMEMNSVQVVPSEWPAKGDITLEDVVLRYREDLDDVLKGISFNVKHGEKVGIVGRTGAGKSSLIYALFLLTPLKSGRIKIDGVDIMSLPLSKVRKSIAIIPQDPVVFGGTLRRNLDPFNEHEDEELWQCLERVDLKQAIDPEKGLNMVVSEGGDNWSTGQRQLICLARAMLRQAKILILDEATASVDLATDAMIQKSLREHFTQCTILTIAHRLNTILDYDKIVVLNLGKIDEIGSPKELAVKKGTFYSMCVEQDVVKQIQ